jgi:hypothetical protein
MAAGIVGASVPVRVGAATSWSRHTGAPPVSSSAGTSSPTTISLAWTIRQTRDRKEGDDLKSIGTTTMPFSRQAQKATIHSGRFSE